MPRFKKIINQAKSYNYKVLFHSCGAISKIISELIDAGIDGFHPLQAKVKGMDAENLAREYKKDLVFVGGVDTQELLPFGTTEKVRRLKKLFGERFIVSPSHEGVLPNYPTEEYNCHELCGNRIDQSIDDYWGGDVKWINILKLLKTPNILEKSNITN